MALTKEKLEKQQIGIYVITLIISVLVGLNWHNSRVLEKAIEPIIGILLYSMFCQIPFLELKQAFKSRSFFKALFVGNFVFVPLVVWGLISIFPTTPILTLGILLVLLTPCIDYVIVFSHLGKGNSKAILAATPLLFVLQLVLLPVYLGVFLGKETMNIIEIAPFASAFLYLIVIPFLLSVVTQVLSKSNNRIGNAILDGSGWLPVPFMALTFFVVMASQVGTLYANREEIGVVIPIYVLFAIVAPVVGKLAASLFKVDIRSSRAVSFSTGTRNSLVVLPLALSLPAPENQLVAMVIVSQTIIEIFFELVYIKVIPLLTPERKPGPC